MEPHGDCADVFSDKLKYLAPLVLAIASLTFETSASAFDCSKAKTKLEKFICSDAEMKKADDQMNAAFFALLSKTKDKDFREALIKSQKRWLENRTPDGKVWAEGAGTDVVHEDGPEVKQFIIDASSNRKDFLQSEDPIVSMETQRNLRLKDGGGKYEGYYTSCWFVEPPWGEANEYVCVGMMRRQKGNRVCTAGSEWASGHETYVRVVSEVVNGQLKHIATCKEGYSGNTCPGQKADEGAHWTINPKDVEKDTTSVARFWKYDPDSTMVEGRDWTDDCVEQQIYPPANEAQSDQP